MKPLHFLIFFCLLLTSTCTSTNKEHEPEQILAAPVSARDSLAVSANDTIETTPASIRESVIEFESGYPSALPYFPYHLWHIPNRGTPLPSFYSIYQPLIDTTVPHAYRFNRFLEVLTTQSLPYNIDCNYEHGANENDSFPHVMYHPAISSGIFAKMPSYTPNFNLLFFYRYNHAYQAHLYSLNSDRALVDSLIFPFCGADELPLRSSYAYFDKDNIIKIIDTLRYQHYAEEIPDPIIDSIRVEEKYYSISASGTFLREK